MGFASGVAARRYGERGSAQDPPEEGPGARQPRRHGDLGPVDHDGVPVAQPRAEVAEDNLRITLDRTEALLAPSG